MTARLTPVELAERWQRPVEWIRQHARDFGGFKVGATWRFDLTEIELYETRQRVADPLRMTELSEKRRSA